MNDHPTIRRLLDDEEFQVLIKEIRSFNPLISPFELAEAAEVTASSLAELNGRYFIEKAKAEAIEEFAEKVVEILKRYDHLHKYAEKARHSTEEYADGTPIEMVSVWEVLSLKKWEMCDYETMSTLQDNIETIAKARLLSELEKDFMLLKKEKVGDSQ